MRAGVRVANLAHLRAVPYHGELLITVRRRPFEKTTRWVALVVVRQVQVGVRVHLQAVRVRWIGVSRHLELKRLILVAPWCLPNNRQVVRVEGGPILATSRGRRQAFCGVVGSVLSHVVCTVVASGARARQKRDQQRNPRLHHPRQLVRSNPGIAGH